MRGIMGKIQDEGGQALAEYALILGLIAVVAVAVLFGVGYAISRLF